MQKKKRVYQMLDTPSLYLGGPGGDNLRLRDSQGLYFTLESSSSKYHDMLQPTSYFFHRDRSHGLLRKAGKSGNQG